MTAEQLVVGNKYVPFQKTTGIEFSQSDFIQQSLPYLYYKKCVSGLERHTFSKNMEMLGDYYNPEDVYEYIESHNGICRGDLVVVTNNGKSYTTFGSAFEKLNFKNKLENDLWAEGSTGTVFGFLYNNFGNVMVALNDSHGNQTLIGIEGVELAVQSTTDFVLPEKWAIAVTAENKDELSKWRAGALYDSNGYCLSIHQGYWVESLGQRYEDYTLISTGIFQKYVLGKTTTDMPTQEQTPQTETKQYPKTPEGLYDMTLDMLNLEPGDIVKVTHKTPSHYMGWSNAWCVDMDAMIGNEYEVSRISDTRHGISLVGQPFNFPPYSLEFVRKGGHDESFHISKTIGRLKYGADAVVKFDEPVTELCASDVYWLAKLFVLQNRKNELRIADL